VLNDQGQHCRQSRPNIQMAADPNHPPSGDVPQTDAVPPLLAKTVPPLAGIPPSSPRPPFASVRELLVILLSLGLGLFLADAFIFLAESSIALVFNTYIFSGLGLSVGLLAMLVALVIYVLMAFLPAIPKRLFVPLALFYLVMGLAAVPLCLLYPERLALMLWLASIGQVALGLWLLQRARGGLKFGWPLVPLEKLGNRRFSWGNLIGFALLNVLGLPLVVVVYLGLCTAGLVDHFTHGFMTLHPGGFTVEVRKYVRADGKTIQLFPMSHIAERNFYREISETFPTNSIILMEGVSDEKHLLKHEINYHRMAQAVGLSEQQEEFEPTRGEMVMADIDVDQFTTNTLDLLNLVLRIHGGKLDVGTLQKIMEYSTAPQFQDQLIDDLVRKRNQHLVAQIQIYLPETGHIVVPWGVAHMPGIEAEILRAGFRLEGTVRYEVIRFRHN